MMRITDISKFALATQMVQGNPVSPVKTTTDEAGVQGGSPAEGGQTGVVSPAAPAPAPAPAPLHSNANTTPSKSTPTRAAPPSNAFKHAQILRACMAPVSPTSKLAKHASYGFPTDLAPAGAMPPNPAAQFGSFMDIARPLRHPIESAKNFVSGLGTEADRMLTQSMVEQPITIHQQQQHPLVTN